MAEAAERRPGQPPHPAAGTTDAAGLPRGFFARTALEVAPDLLGAVLQVGPVAVRLTEVEAYEGERDPGSHAFRGRTARNAVMFGPAGHLYVYFTYGMHHCTNVVCGPEGRASAVLLRGGEVVTGEDVARERRTAQRPVPHRDLARGPARMARALGLDLHDNGTDLCPAEHEDAADDPGRRHARVTARASPPDASRLRTGPRVGVRGSGGDGTAYPWRFWLADEATVSVYRPAAPRLRARPSSR